jgi:predicted amidophosphoribosyltransferase
MAQAVKICKQCGKKIGSGTKYCAKCGKKV